MSPFAQDELIGCFFWFGDFISFPKLESVTENALVSSHTKTKHQKKEH